MIILQVLFNNNIDSNRKKNPANMIENSLYAEPFQAFYTY